MILPGFPVMIGGGSSFGQVPVGGILLWESTTPPAGGWELYYTSAMNNRALRGVGPDTPEGATGGQNRYTVTGTTNFAGDHGGSAFQAYGNPSGTSVPSVQVIKNGPTSDAGGHVHSLNVSVSHTARFRSTNLIRKVEGPGLVPVGASVLHGRPNLPPGYDVVLDFIGRVLRATNSTTETSGRAFPTSATYTTSSAGNHYHGANLGNSGTISSNPYVPSNTNTPSGAHSHSVQVSLDLRLNSVGVAQCRAEEVAQAIHPGMVIAFDGGGPLPAGWRDADGTGGTLDIRDRFPILSDLSQAGVVLGTGNTIWVATSVSYAGGHSHQGGSRGYFTSYNAAHGDDKGGHTHTFPTRGGTVDAAWYGIRFIQYIP